MNVFELINRANPEEVASIYTEIYCKKRSDGWNTVEAFNEFRARLCEIKPEENPEGMVVLLKWVTLNETDEYFDVSLRDKEGKVWSASFTPWDLWRVMDVVVETSHNLSLNDIATHVYYEMTWYGWPEEAKKISDEIRDQVESLNLDSCTPLDEFLDEFQKDLDKDQSENGG